MIAWRLFLWEENDFNHLRRRSLHILADSSSAAFNYPCLMRGYLLVILYWFEFIFADFAPAMFLQGLEAHTSWIRWHLCILMRKLPSDILVVGRLQANRLPTRSHGIVRRDSFSNHRSARKGYLHDAHRNLFLLDDRWDPASRLIWLMRTSYELWHSISQGRVNIALKRLVAFAHPVVAHSPGLILLAIIRSCIDEAALAVVGCHLVTCTPHRLEWFHYSVWYGFHCDGCL